MFATMVRAYWLQQEHRVTQHPTLRMHYEKAAASGRALPAVSCCSRLQQAGYRLATRLVLTIPVPCCRAQGCLSWSKL